MYFLINIGIIIFDQRKSQNSIFFTKLNILILSDVLIYVNNNRQENSQNGKKVNDLVFGIAN
jgi:hypothetical protein